jgi:hypothetical protein
LLTLQIRRRIRLEGAELEAYYAQRRDEERAAMRVRLDEQRRAARASALNDSDSDSDDEVKPNTAAPTATTQHTMAQVCACPHAHVFLPRHIHTMSCIGWNCNQDLHSSNNQSVPIICTRLQRKNLKYVRSRETLLSLSLQFDEYGEVIRPEDYTVAESLVPTSQFGEDDETADKESVVNAREVPTKCIKSVTKLEVLCKVRIFLLPT